MEISALTYNFLGIPLFSKAYKKRLSLFINELRELEPDIFCLQEIWLPGAKNKLISSLKDLGYSFYFPRAKFRLCGLLTGVKGEILEHNYVSTKSLVTGFDLSVLEMFGSKGYLILKTKINDEIFYIINVHFNADFTNKYNSDSSYTKTHERSVSYLISDINKFKNEKIILLGDFNFQPGGPAYCKLINSSGLTDIIPVGFNTFLGGVLPFCPTHPGHTDFIFTKNIL